MTNSTHTHRVSTKGTRLWPWALGVFALLILSGLIRPSSLGLEPTLESLEERAKLVAPDASIGDIAQALGKSPDVVGL